MIRADVLWVGERFALTDRGQARRAPSADADPEPWTEAGPHWIQVVPRFISGRRFQLDEGLIRR